MSSMQKFLKLLLFVFLSAAGRMQTLAQPLSISVAVNPPYSSDFTQYFSSPTQTLVTIINSGSDPQTVFLAGSISNLTVDKSVRIPADQVPQVPPLVIEPGVRILNGAELQTFVNPASLQFSGLTQQEVLNGNLPEGLYQICLQAIDFNTLEPRSAPEPSGCSNIFQISFLQPPLLIQPVCDTEVPFSNPQNVLFTWVPPAGISPGPNLQYRFRLIEMPPGMNPVQAMQSVTVPILNDITVNNFLLLTALGPTLQSGRDYAWQVTAEDLTGEAVFTNQGKSEVCIFRTGLPSGGSSSVQAVLVYPSPEIKIPFRNVPLVARYEPFSENHTGFSAQTSISGGDIGDEMIRQQVWTSGRENFVTQQINQSPSLEQLLHVEIGRDLFLSPGSSLLRRNATHTVSSQLEFSQSDGSSQNCAVTGSFQAGMIAPKLKSPILDTSLTSHSVSIKFSTPDYPPATANTNLLLPPQEIRKSLQGTRPFWFLAQISERYKLEISRSATFDSIIQTVSGLYEVSDSVKHTTSEQAFRLKISKEFTHDFFLPDTGRYFWRVSWLQNPLDTNSAPYATSQTGRFFIHDGVAGEQVNSACMGECDSPLPEDRTAVTSIAIGDTVKIGKFNLVISEISYLGPAARGKGTIKVPFMNSNLKVSFNDLQINAAKQVFSGNAGADYDNAGFMPNLGQGETTFNPPPLDSLQQFLESGRGLVSMDPNAPVGLPVGLDNTVAGEKITIGILAASFKPTKATLAAGVNVPLYGLKDLLDTASGIGITNVGLGAADICFHPGGLAGPNMGTLYLPEDIEYFFAKDQRIKLNGSRVDPISGVVADSGCYVSWDCEGFRAFRIKGAVHFDSTMLVSESLDGKPNPLVPVEARFGLTIRQTGNFMAELDFDRFQIPGIEGWGFQVKKATIDISDLANPAGMQFPATYQGDRSVLWNGIHIAEMNVFLPHEFEKKEGESPAEGSDSTAVSDTLNTSGQLKSRTGFRVAHLIIDNSGITGQLSAFNLIALEQGSLAGWGFSLDSINVSLVSNSFASGGFQGKIVTPLSPDRLRYSSVLSQTLEHGLQYQFTVAPKDTLSIPMWIATANILPTSSVNITVDSSGFKPSMNLNGDVSIVGMVGEIPVNFAGVHFEQLKVQTVEPMLSCNAFSFASPQKEMAGFKVSLSDAHLKRTPSHGLFNWDDTEGDRIALEFTVNVHFTGEANTFAGATTLAILSRLDLGDLDRGPDEPDPNPDQFDFPSLVITGVDLETIMIDCMVSGNGFKGFIRFYAQDSTYGTGFIGGIELSLKDLLTAKAILSFGSIDDHTYWYADVSARMTPGIPVYSGLELFGGAGGVSYGVTLQEIPPPGANVAKDPDPFPLPGTTLSGIKLVPDPEAGFGFKIGIMFGSTGGGQVYNADVTVTGILSQSGGLMSMALEGNAFFVTDPVDRTFQGIRASVLMQYDVPQQILTGLFGVMINVPMTIVGRQPGNMAGSAFLYAGPDKWQILVGAPDLPSRVGVRVANMFDFSAYLMAGQQLPAPPAPPEKIEQILGPGTIVRSPAISSGTGLAFGASFIPPKFNQQYLIFHANLDAEIGFDMNMFDYGAARCDGMPSGESLGMNGWYASGAAYAYLEGSIGIDVDMFGEMQQIKILDISAAALMQAGFPNPGWVKGTIGGNYSILGGMIKGNCRYEFAYGTQCTPPVESPLSGLKMISAINPDNARTEVDCGTGPVALFNVDINRSLPIEKMNSDGTVSVETYRFEIDYFRLKKGSVVVSTSLSYDEDGSRAMITPSDLLASYTNYTVEVKLKALKRVNGAWVAAQRLDGSVISETLSSTFKTGAQPDRIRESDVQYSIPLDRQRYFTRNTCTNGLIQLRYNMAYLFNTQARSGYTREYKARFIPQSGGTTVETDVTYNSSEKRVHFSLPALAASKIYKIQIIHRDKRNSLNEGPATVSGSILPAVSTQYASMMLNNVQLRSRIFEGPGAIANNEFLYYEFSFRTGIYSTIQDKINAMSTAGTQYMDYSPYEMLGLKMSAPEIFEKYEVEGYEYLNGLTRIKFRLFNINDAFTSSWHSGHIKPVIYDLYTRVVQFNYSTIRFSRSNPDVYGIPPTGIAYGSGLSSPLSDSEINPGMVSSSSSGSSIGGFTLAGGNVSGSGISAFPGLSLTNPTCTLIMETSWNARSDYNRMGSIVASMISRYGTLLSGIDGTTRTWVNRYRTTAYKNMYHTTYTARFSGIILPGCPQSAPYSILKTFVY